MTTAAEENELQALLSLDLTGLDRIGLEDPAFAQPVQTAAPAGQATPAAPGAAPPKTAAAPASTEPFSRSLARIAERLPTHKGALVQAYQNAAEQVREAYDLMCLGEAGGLAPLRAASASLQETFRRDPPVVLALSLSRSNSPLDYQHRHAVNVAILTMAAATAAGYSKADVGETGKAALAADVGMRLVPEAILGKSGKLSEEELAEIQRHSGHSAALLEIQEGNTPLLTQVALQHHERMTGGGYPNRLSGAQIVPEARMVAIADTLAAMVHKRSHRDALAPHEALERVIKMAQMNFLDFDLLKGLVGFLSLYPVGSAVDIGKGRLGRVVEANPGDPARPVVAVLREGNSLLGPKSIYRVDLKGAREEKILKCLDPEAAGFKGLDGF